MSPAPAPIACDASVVFNLGHRGQLEALTAAKSVAFKFSQWLDAHNRDDDGDDDDYSPNEPGHDDDGCPTT